MEEEKKKCFVIMPISDADGYEKGHFTRVYEHLIKPAIEQAGFKPDRADDTSKANYIVVDILQKILACDIAICDLSSRNPNVFYELGIRQAFNKKTVLIKDSKTVMPFDISGIRTLSYNDSLRVDEVKKDILNLAKCISETNEADINEVNSLLQLLSIEQPATLPSKVILSEDSSMILNAINKLSDRVDKIANPNNSTDSKLSITLPNGETLSIGEYIEDTNGHRQLGILSHIGDDSLMIKNGNQYLFIQLDSKQAQTLAQMPF